MLVMVAWLTVLPRPHCSVGGQVPAPYAHPHVSGTSVGEWRHQVEAGGPV